MWMRISLGWARYVGAAGRTLCLDRFGASAPYKVLAEKFGFTVENVLKNFVKMSDHQSLRYMRVTAKALKRGLVTKPAKRTWTKEKEAAKKAAAAAANGGVRQVTSNTVRREPSRGNA